ncbi:hypothetical protein CRG98_046843 [Punica granatum]|uniref:Uncharacterized protein n=1 Tax=Punica granatum TaxID=22663 RepID=A0A2I0HM18_PUNGR|nr:hypothetical protein CRG98_046843 [Punica granatum]
MLCTPEFRLVGAYMRAPMQLGWECPPFRGRATDACEKELPLPVYNPKVEGRLCGTDYRKLVAGVDRSLGSIGVVRTPKEPRDQSLSPEVVQKGLVCLDLSRLKSGLDLSQDIRLVGSGGSIESGRPDWCKWRLGVRVASLGYPNYFSNLTRKRKRWFGRLWWLGTAAPDPGRLLGTAGGGSLVEGARVRPYEGETEDGRKTLS